MAQESYGQMQGLSLSRWSVADVCDGGVSHSRALAGALIGAMTMATIYGLLGRYASEPVYGAFLIGMTSGGLAYKLGGGRSILSGMAAAVISLFAVLIAKIIVGSPAGITWAAHHTHWADLVFCYLANPLIALFGVATDGLRDTGRYLRGF